MLRQELLPYLETLDTLYKFMLVNKGSYNLIKIHYLECWDRFKVLLMRERWRISDQEFSHIEEEAKIERLDDMRSISGKIFKSIRDQFTFHRYSSDNQAFETLGYPGREWSWL
jgi:hypothetical protein